MNEGFYTILVFSLLLTIGVVLLIYVYRMVLRSMKNHENRIPYAVLYAIEKYPASGEVAIRYELGAEHPVELKIVNNEDQIQLTLVNETKSKGSYHISFDSSQLEDGNYYYRLQTGNQSITKPITIKNK